MSSVTQAWAGRVVRGRALDTAQARGIWAAAALVLVFWALTVRHLERWPRVNEGEALIVSLGYKLFDRGVYGTDLFAGFHGMDRHYFLITPLMSVVQGANTRLLGMGLFQWRLAGAAAGALTCALTFAAGRRLMDTRMALLAVGLLIGWQWARAGAHAMVPTGIPLMDVARIVRHDILTAPLGLAAWCAFMRQRRTGRLGYAALSGLLTGLAGLAHIYGLFWGAAFGLALGVERRWGRRSPWLPALLIAAGAAAAWVPAAVFILENPEDFAAQAMQSRTRFEVLSPAFYASNLTAEIHRYHLGWREPAARWSPGAWLLVLGVPAAALALGRQAARCRDRSALWLLAPAVVFPALFALLIEPKTFNYLVAVAPVWALALAWAVARLSVAWPGAGRMLAAAVVALVLTQGAISLSLAQASAGLAPRPAETYKQLRALVPAGARVLGHQHFWPGLYDREFRSFGLPFFLASAAMTPKPVSFRAALEQVRPEYVLLDAVMRPVFAESGTKEAAANSAQFWTFMDAHEAVLIETLPGGAEGPVQLYRLTW